MIPSVNPVFDAMVAAMTPAQREELEARWSDIQGHSDIGGKNADYARRTRLILAASELLARAKAQEGIDAAERAYQAGLTKLIAGG